MEINNKIKIEGSTWKILIKTNGIESWRLAYPTNEGFKPALEDDEETVIEDGYLKIISI